MLMINVRRLMYIGADTGARNGRASLAGIGRD